MVLRNPPASHSATSWACSKTNGFKASDPSHWFSAWIKTNGFKAILPNPTVHQAGHALRQMVTFIFFIVIFTVADAALYFTLLYCTLLSLYCDFDSFCFLFVFSSSSSSSLLLLTVGSSVNCRATFFCCNSSAGVAGAHRQMPGAKKAVKRHQLRELYTFVLEVIKCWIEQSDIVCDCPPIVFWALIFVNSLNLVSYVKQSLCDKMVLDTGIVRNSCSYDLADLIEAKLITLTVFEWRPNFTRAPCEVIQTNGCRH